jgi:6-phosphogluconolactonase
MVDTLKLAQSTVHICKDQNELGDASARAFIASMQEAITSRGRGVVALSGGHTPHILYKRLLQDDLHKAVDWSKVHFFVGDERCVPATSEDNNFGNAQRLFLSKLNIPQSNLHPTAQQDSDPDASAGKYEAEIKKFFGIANGELPQFDMIHLGMGPDGHCASLFPGTRALDETGRLVVANHVEKLHTNRITFTFPLINNARYVMFMVEGEEKAAVLAEALQSDTVAYPVQKIKPRSGKLEWFVDEAAARDLKVRK